MVKSMALKGSSGGSLGAYETSPEWRKKKREKISVLKTIVNESRVQLERENCIP